MNVALSQLSGEKSFNTILPLMLEKCSDEDIYTIFDVICKRGYVESFKLLSSKYDMLFSHLYGSTKYTPFHLVSISGHVDLLCEMLKHNQNLDAKCEWGMTPLLHACGKGHKQIVATLIDHGADVFVSSGEFNALVLAVSSGNDELVKDMESFGLKISESERDNQIVQHLVTKKSLNKIQNYILTNTKNIPSRGSYSTDDPSFIQKYIEAHNASKVLKHACCRNKCDIVRLASQYTGAKYNGASMFTFCVSEISTIYDACKNKCEVCVSTLLELNRFEYTDIESIWKLFYNKYDSKCAGLLVDKLIVEINGHKHLSEPSLIKALIKHNDIGLIQRIIHILKNLDIQSDYLECALTNNACNEIIMLLLEHNAPYYDDYVKTKNIHSERMQPLIIDYLRSKNEKITITINKMSNLVSDMNAICK